MELLASLLDTYFKEGCSSVGNALALSCSDGRLALDLTPAFRESFGAADTEALEENFDDGKVTLELDSLAELTACWTREVRVDDPTVQQNLAKAGKGYLKAAWYKGYELYQKAGVGARDVAAVVNIAGFLMGGSLPSAGILPAGMPGLFVSAGC